LHHLFFIILFAVRNNLCIR